MCIRDRANAGNLFAGLLARGLGVTTSSTALPAGGLDLFIRYFRDVYKRQVLNWGQISSSSLQDWYTAS